MDSGVKPLPRFDLGLSLAGGVSCGAYTAGVVDFVVEALDAWQDGRDRGDADAPPHEIAIRVVAGASSGALTAAILTAALKYDFVPARAGCSDEEARSNPLFDSWVNMTGISDLLGTRDSADRRLHSLLDPTRLDEVARRALDFGVGVQPRTRRWIAEPLRVDFTVTNVRGVPFSLAPGGAPSEDLRARMHGEVMRFALTGLGGHHATPPRPDEFTISFPADPLAKREGRWRDFAMAALASAAFPAMLPARQLRRRAADYSDMPIVLPGGPGKPAEVVSVSPIGSEVGDGWYEFAAVDGGLIDNDPVDVVRVELNERDVLARNPREGDLSTRAVLAVNPLLGDDAPAQSSARQFTVSRVLPALLRTLLDQVRFRPTDVALALREDVYSRFLIAPTPSGTTGSESSRHLAGANLGGFGGYLAREFREHDFRLGRRNAQLFLADRLTLPRTNPLFAQWGATQRARYEIPGSDELPIIPLVGKLHPRHGQAEPQPAWPLGYSDPDALAPLLDRRLEAVYWRMLRSLLLRLILYPGWRLLVRWQLRNRLCAALKAGLRKHGLL